MHDDSQREFLRLYSGCSAQLYSLVWRLHPRPSEVDDIFQELSLRLWTNFDRFDRSRSFAPWAAGVCRLIVMEHRRRRGGGVLLSEEVLEKLAILDDRVDADRFAERRHALGCCVKKLTQHEQSLIQMRYRDRLASKEIAESVGCSIHSVYRAFSRVHRNLAECVRRQLATT